MSEAELREMRIRAVAAVLGRVTTRAREAVDAWRDSAEPTRLDEHMAALSVALAGWEELKEVGGCGTRD